MPPDSAASEAPLRHVHKPLPHDSAAKHVQGAAEYIDDIPEPAGTLHVAVGGSPVARGTHRAASILPRCEHAGRRRGRHRGATYRARTTFRRRTPTSRCSPQDRVIFHGQPVFAVVATSRDAARRAALLGAFDIEAESPNVSVEQGKASGERVLPDYAFINGDAGKGDRRRRRFALPARSTSAARSTFIWKARSRSPCRARTAPCWSIRPPSIRAKCSTSSPAFSALPDSFVTCTRAPHGRRLRRQGDAGDAVGGDRRLAARATGRPCKLRLDRDADMVMTGKRHDFAVDYAVGYEADGRIAGRRHRA